MQSNDAYGAVAGLGASQHGAFTRSQATRIGLRSRDISRLIESNLVIEPVRGVLVFVAAPRSPKQDLWVATHASGGGFVAAFESAAWLHGIDGFDQPPDPEVIGARGRRLRGAPDVIQHVGTVDKADLVVIEGIECTGWARTVCDVTAKLGRDVGLRSIDDFERRGQSLLWLSRTADRLDRPGQSGTKVVRQLLTERSGQAPDTWFERLVGRCLAFGDLPPWERQYRVADDDGRFLGRVDLACPSLRLGVEAHSKRYHFGVAAGGDDQARDDDMAAAGWNLRYVGWYAATKTPDQVAAMIARIARRRAIELGVALPRSA